MPVLSEEEIKKHFEANMFDGDDVHLTGQMLNSKFVLEYIIALFNEQIRAAVIAELTDIKSVATTADNMWYRHIEKRLQQLQEGKS